MCISYHLVLGHDYCGYLKKVSFASHVCYHITLFLSNHKNIVVKSVPIILWKVKKEKVGNMLVNGTKITGTKKIGQ